MTGNTEIEQENREAGKAIDAATLNDSNRPGPLGRWSSAAK